MSFIALCSKYQTDLLTSCFQTNKTIGTFISLVLLAYSLVFSGISSAQTSITQLTQSLEKGLLSGKPVWLKDSRSKFFAVYDVDQSGIPKGAVIILHDANRHPDEPEVVRPLRSELPMHGWATIAIQLPYLSSIPDYNNKQSIINQRINSATNYLQTNGISNIILLGHGTGAMAATAYLSVPQESTIQAFIAISLGILDKNIEFESISQQLEKITVPILDIYGSNDLDHVINTARLRASAAKISSKTVTSSRQIDSYKRSAIAISSTQNSKGYISYRQIIITGASHDFSGNTAQLTQRITGWLNRHAKGTIINTRP